MPVTSAWARGLAFATIVALFAGGLAALWRRTPVIVAFLIAYLMEVAFWPFEPDRFLFALWPLLAIAVAYAVSRLVPWSVTGRRAQLARVAPFIAAAVVATGYGTYNVRGFRHQWWSSVQRDSGRDAKPIVEWVARHTAMSDVLSTQHDLIVYLYTDRQAIPVSGFPASVRVTPLSQDEIDARARLLIEEYRPRFFITAWPAAIEAAQSLSTGPSPLLRPAGNTTNADVFERVSR
jgi:hypothetical protein